MFKLGNHLDYTATEYNAKTDQSWPEYKEKTYIYKKHHARLKKKLKRNYKAAKCIEYAN